MEKKGAATQSLETIREIPGTARILSTARETRHWGRISLGGNQEGRGRWADLGEVGVCPLSTHGFLLLLHFG